MASYTTLEKEELEKILAHYPVGNLEWFAPLA